MGVASHPHVAQKPPLILFIYFYFLKKMLKIKKKK